MAPRPSVDLLALKHELAPLELLWRWSRGDLRADVTLVISNQGHLRVAVEGFGVRFARVLLDGQAEKRMQEMSVDGPRRRKRDLKWHVQARAVCWQAEDRIHLDRTTTVVLA